MKPLTLALDWTPNINHIGFFIAQEKGFYTNEDISLRILDPSMDNYLVTPAKKVELGIADVALCPTESIISYRTKEKSFPLIAIAAILQEDLSAIVVKKDTEINSPKDLDGKSYASYKARYEDAIVKQMIQNDGGNGTLNIEYPNKLGIWDTVLNNTCDATWVFVNWEGVEAQNSNIELHYFKMSNYAIPYSYSPVIVTDENTLDIHHATHKSFLKATKQGYLFAKENSEEAIAILKKFLPEKDKSIDLQKALSVSTTAFGDISNWGKIKLENITSFLNWIYNNKLESKQITATEMFTNSLL